MEVRKKISEIYPTSLSEIYPEARMALPEELKAPWYGLIIPRPTMIMKQSPLPEAKMHKLIKAATAENNCDEIYMVPNRYEPKVRAINDRGWELWVDWYNNDQYTRKINACGKHVIRDGLKSSDLYFYRNAPDSRGNITDDYRAKEHWCKWHMISPLVINTLGYLRFGYNYGREAEIRYNEAFVSKYSKLQVQQRIYELVKLSVDPLVRSTLCPNLLGLLKFTLEVQSWVNNKKGWITWSYETYLDSDLPETCFANCFRCGKCTLVHCGCCSPTTARVIYKFDNGRVINPVWLSALLGHQMPHFLPYEIELAKEMVPDMRWVKANEEKPPGGFPFVRDITVVSTELEWDRRLRIQSGRPERPNQCEEDVRFRRMINNLQAPDKAIREGWWTALYNENNVKKMDNDPFEMHFVPGYETIYTSGSWNHLLPSDEWFPEPFRDTNEHRLQASKNSD